MSDPRIRQALEKHLGTASPDLPTALQGADFDPEIEAPDGAPYQECFILPADNRTLGVRQRTTLHTGIFQVNLCYPAGSGAGDAEARGKLLQEHFAPATTVLTQGGITVRILGKPKVGAEIGGKPGRFEIPVSITYRSTFS